jgi:shikimate kinase
MANSPPANIVLLGYRGCGKSRVGRLLAQRLGWGFVDTDEQVEADSGQTIEQIFAQRGEGGFRQLERAAVASACAGTHQVISVGGGAVLDEANRRELRGAGLCVWLTAPAEELHRRILADSATPSRRPALTTHPGLDEIRHLLTQRQPLYAATAAHVVSTAERTAEEVAAAVQALWLAGPASPQPDHPGG